MPKNSKHAGIRLPRIIRGPIGTWIRNKFAGMRLAKNTNISDYQHLCIYAGKKTHTSPVVRTKQNAGLHLKANKQYAKNEQRKQNLRRGQNA